MNPQESYNFWWKLALKIVCTKNITGTTSLMSLRLLLALCLMTVLGGLVIWKLCSTGRLLPLRQLPLGLDQQLGLDQDHNAIVALISKQSQFHQRALQECH